MYLFPRILSLSSNRKAQNSPSPFQFETSDRELTPQPTKTQNLSISTPECHEFWRPGNYSRPETRESTKPAQKHMNFNLNALIDPKLYTP